MICWLTLKSVYLFYDVILFGKRYKWICKRLCKLFTSFIKEMVKLGYAAEMNEIFEAYYRYWDEKNHIIRAELISAEAATDEEANDAKALLQSKYPEYEISLTQKVDETLLGGYVIKTLNTEYDRSYEGKLRELERKLTRR